MKIYYKISQLLNGKNKAELVTIVLLMLIMAVLEVLGIGSVIPFLTVLGDPDSMHQNPYLDLIFNYLSFESKGLFIWFLGLSSVFFLILGTIFKMLTYYRLHMFANMQRHEIGKKLLKRYLSYDYEFFLRKNSSEISKIILSEVDQVVGTVLIPSLMIVINVFVSIFIALFIIYIDPALAISTLVIFGTLYLIIFSSLVGKLSYIGRQRTVENSKRFKTISEVIGGVKDIKLYGKEKEYLKGFETSSLNFAKYAALNKIYATLPQYLVESIIFIVIIISALLFFNSEGASLNVVLPMLGVYTMSIFKIKPAISNIYSSLSSIKFGENALDRLLNEFNNDSKLDVNSKSNKIESNSLFFNNNLQFDNVRFKYDQAKMYTLKDISLIIKKNTNIGIVGVSGSGKSTLIDLMLGLLKPTSGHITIDGCNLTNENIRNWQDMVGYVPQNIYLTDDSIANNIAFGVSTSKIDMEHVKYVAKLSQIDDFIINLNDGYDTVIGERGARISGGQRQRLGIARALYQNPAILVMDEATSALDEETERKLIESIYTMKGNKTIIMIAHRLSTIDICDSVYKIESGSISKIR
jgi:ATP-binding cassette, subfamily B, bacterial PglK